MQVDDKAAVVWLTRAAEAGDAESARNLGVRHAAGRGVAQDPAAAIRWLRVASEAGDAAAMFNLGLILAEGKGVVEDDALGFKWMKAAADRGDPPAMLRLAIMYRDGEGVGRDATEASYWSSLAAETVGAELQEKAVATRFELAEGISKQSRADADERVDAWRAARKTAPRTPSPAGGADPDGATTADKL